MKSLSYTNNMQSLEKFSLTINTEGFMVTQMPGTCCCRNQLGRNNTHTSIRVFLGVSLLFFSLSHSSQWQARHSNMRLEGNLTAFDIKAFKTQIHSTEEGLMQKWHRIGKEEQAEMAGRKEHWFLSFPLHVHWRTVWKTIRQLGSVFTLWLPSQLVHEMLKNTAPGPGREWKVGTVNQTAQFLLWPKSELSCPLFRCSAINSSTRIIR